MTTEVQTEAIEEQAPPVVVDAASETPAPTPPKRIVKRAEPVKTEPLGQSAEVRAMNDANEKTIKSIIQSMGGLSFKASITRKKPDEIQDPITQKWVSTAGFLKEVDHEIDEEWLSNRYGGGTYEIKFSKPNPKGGWQYAGQVTVSVAGEPNLAEMPRAARPAAAPVAPAGPTPENPSLVKDAFSFMAKQVENAQNNAKSGPDDAVLAMMQRQLEAAERRNEALLREMRDLRDAQLKTPAKTSEDTVRDKMLDKLIDGDSARITALRAQYDSEIRQLNESRREDERRFNDRLERELAMLRQQQDRELATMRSSHEVALQAVRSSTEVQVISSKSAFDTQLSLVKSENDRLRAENTELRTELKELRAKKEKSPVEMIKDMQIIKEALGVDEDDDEPKTLGAQIAEAASNPATWEGIGSLVGRVRGPEAAPAQAQAQPKGGLQKRVILVHGKKMMLLEDGKTVVPIKQKAQPATEDGKPAEPVMPEMDPAVIGAVVKFMESAFEGNQEPAVFAQGARSRVPEELMQAIRDHGVDAVMSKMAKLSSTSVLASQRGRVWVRSVAEALVGT